MANTVSLVSGACKYIHTNGCAPSRRLQVMCTAKRVFTRCRKIVHEKKHNFFYLSPSHFSAARSKNGQDRHTNTRPPCSVINLLAPYTRNIYPSDAVLILVSLHVHESPCVNEGWSRSISIAVGGWIVLLGLIHLHAACIGGRLTTKNAHPYIWDTHKYTPVCVVLSCPVWQSNSRGNNSIPLSPLLGCSRASASPPRPIDNMTNWQKRLW